MARAQLNGVGIEYELFGEGPLAIITPGGRYSKDAGGVRELAQALAEGGLTAVIWDRPNCGASDVCFEGESESTMNADMLAELVRRLGRGPAYLIGGSAGSRVSLLTAVRRPDTVSRMFLFWISGGPISLAQLGSYYSTPHAVAAVTGGMEKVVELPEWQEQLAKNPANRELLLAQDPWTFIDTMQRWCAAFFPSPGSPVPGISHADFAALRVPTMVLRSGKVDLYHTREASEQAAKLIPGAQIQDPPWPDDEWWRRTREQHRFGNWPALAPQILAFAKA